MLATHASSKLRQKMNCTARNTPRYRGALAVVLAKRMKPMAATNESAGDERSAQAKFMGEERSEDDGEEEQARKAAR